MLVQCNPSDVHELRTAGFARNRDAFIRGVIGEATYRMSLQWLGLRGQDVTAEVNLAKMEMRPSIRARCS